MTRCYECGKGVLVPGKATIEYSQVKLPYPVILVGVPVRRCPACGAESFTVPDPEGLHHALAKHIISTRRTLYPEEVRFLRKYLDWSASRLAAVMGVDPKTLSRWENGRQKVGSVAERLLRLLVIQRLQTDAQSYTEQVLPVLGHEPEAQSPPLRMTTSPKGWQKAA